jgi:hypothetical protein
MPSRANRDPPVDLCERGQSGGGWGATIFPRPHSVTASKQGQYHPRPEDVNLYETGEWAGSRRRPGWARSLLPCAEMDGVRREVR